MKTRWGLRRVRSARRELQVPWNVMFIYTPVVYLRRP